MVKIKLDKAGLKKLEASANAAMKAVVDKVWESHAGRPETEVRRELRNQMKRVGFGEGSNMDGVAKHIANNVRPVVKA